MIRFILKPTLDEIRMISQERSVGLITAKKIAMAGWRTEQLAACREALDDPFLDMSPSARNLAKGMIMVIESMLGDS